MRVISEFRLESKLVSKFHEMKVSVVRSLRLSPSTPKFSFEEIGASPVCRIRFCKFGVKWRLETFQTDGVVSGRVILAVRLVKVPPNQLPNGTKSQILWRSLKLDFFCERFSGAGCVSSRCFYLFAGNMRPLGSAGGAASPTANL